MYVARSRVRVPGSVILSACLCPRWLYPSSKIVYLGQTPEFPDTCFVNWAYTLSIAVLHL